MPSDLMIWASSTEIDEKFMTMTIWLAAIALLLVGAELSKEGNQLSLVCNIVGWALFIVWIVMKEIKRRNQ